MANAHAEIAQALLLIGGTVVLAVFVRLLLDRSSVPTIVGYIALGLALHLADARWHVLQSEGRRIIGFFEQIGVFCLLFRVGLESQLGGLLREMGHAMIVWLFNIAVSGILGYAACRWVLHLEHVPSLFVGVALTATSVGMALRDWRDTGALQSRDGQLLLDVVELDDLSAVVMMGVLVLIAPFLRHESPNSLLAPFVIRLTLWHFAKLMLFGGVCLLFAALVEPRITALFARRGSASSPLLFALGAGFVLTALGGQLGFSVAIGAFVAGLAFSRDPEATRIDVAFAEVYDLFVPFLFIGIGLKLEVIAVAPALGMAAVLFVVAVLGKLIGGVIPARRACSKRNAWLIGLSLIPRAEIALLILQQGYALGEWAVPANVFSAMALACAGTWLGVPLAVRYIFAKYPPVVETIPVPLGEQAPQKARGAMAGEGGPAPSWGSE